MIGKIPVKFITHVLVFAPRSSPNKRIAATFCGHFNRPVPITDKADIYALFWNVRSYIVSFTLALPCVHTLVRYAQILIRKMRPIIIESKFMRRDDICNRKTKFIALVCNAVEHDPQ